MAQSTLPVSQAERMERERTLSEKIYRLSRDLSDPKLNARQRAQLRAELQAALSCLEALSRAGGGNNIEQKL
ncbi:MAG: hypothetical protein AB1489_19705 [Acidobacteriota bacterium]